MLEVLDERWWDCCAKEVLKASAVPPCSFCMELSAWWDAFAKETLYGVSRPTRRSLPVRGIGCLGRVVRARVQALPPQSTPSVNNGAFTRSLSNLSSVCTLGVRASRVTFLEEA